jgi:hypothetical protein
MKNQNPDKKTAHSGQRPGAQESSESIATFPLHKKRPGQAGLANEVRPGLGTRGTDADPRENEPAERGVASNAKKRRLADTPLPIPPERQSAPSEQDSDSLAQQQQRSTGVSGHAGGT